MITQANKINRDFVHEHRAMIAVAEASWRGSHSWHVFDWMAWKLRCKYPPMWNGGSAVINLDQSFS